MCYYKWLPTPLKIPPPPTHTHGFPKKCKKEDSFARSCVICIYIEQEILLIYTNISNTVKPLKSEHAENLNTSSLLNLIGQNKIIIIV